MTSAHETLVSREDARRLPDWEEAGFPAMERNAARLSDFLKLPSNELVEVGRQIAI
jgi:KUP system potassium uptake protein